ncbi:MAG TPA: M20/M25/M40 family metallo-hydrolase [Thermoanaerobaculia bacterium]|nr:M20/M25/M40 family metallo-hydrolase [Thermoanaerobaculia bacterium]
MKRLAASAALLLFAGCAKAPPPSMQARLAARAEASPGVEAYARALSALGPRVTGSAACAKGEDFAAARLAGVGYAPALESYVRPEGAALDAPARNVLADLPGTDAARGLVLLAAHLDGVAVGQGAADDAVNVAALLEAARTLKALAPRPRRTIRFAFFTGEEQKMAGSSAYVAAHGSEPHALAAVFDLGSGRTKGFYLNGGKADLRALFQRALAPDERWRAVFGVFQIWPGCDAFPFVKAGIPVLTAFQVDPGYAAIHHTASDTVDRLDFAAARETAGLAAALAWGVADDEAPDLPRKTPVEVRELLERYGISP